MLVIIVVHLTFSFRNIMSYLMKVIVAMAFFLNTCKFYLSIVCLQYPVDGKVTGNNYTYIPKHTDQCFCKTIERIIHRRFVWFP